jgi:predicted metal-dependent peptidase
MADNNDVLELIKKVRFKLTIQQPFFGTFMQSLELKIDEVTAPTAYTNGRVLGFNPNFVRDVLKNDVAMVEFVIGHELLHVVLMHCNKSRCVGFDPQTLNIAMDYRVNFDLVAAGIGQIREEYYYSTKYDETWTVEAIYKDLMDNGDDGKGNPVPPPEGSGSGGGGNSMVGDHSQWDELSNEEKEELRRSVIKSYQSAKQQGGNVPASVEREYNEFLSPKMPWQDLIIPTVLSYRLADKSWAKFNRRFLQRKMILPWYEQAKTAKFCLAFDVSGSITPEECLIFLSEMKGIFDVLDDFECYCLCFHDRVEESSFKHFKKGDPFDYNLVGCGGTDIGCITDFLKTKDDVDIDHIFVFTDCCSSTWCDEDYAEITYISTTDQVGDGGETVHYN